MMAIAAEMVNAHTGLPLEGILQSFAVHPGYATPKVDVRGAVIRDDKILLVQERVDGMWCMPGGWADVGDLPSETVVREVWEESGFHVVPRRTVGVYDANRVGRPLSFYHAYKIIFLCDIIGGNARSRSETQAVGFYDFDSPPPLSSERTGGRHLEDVRTHLMDEARPAVFD